MIDVGDFAYVAPESAGLSSIIAYVETVDPPNPIDSFLLSRSEIIRTGVGSLIDGNPLLGRLLLVGAVSAFENYCRGILSGCLELCPISQSRSSEKNVSLGGAIWHGRKGSFNRSAFEHKSFADAKELKSVFKEYIDFDLSSSTYFDLLRSFETIMQLRHAIVHSDGVLPGRNAVKLEVRRTGSALAIRINQSRLQECILVLNSLVVTINRNLFSDICKRWAVDWRRRADWDPDTENKTIYAIFDLFVHSTYNQALKNRQKWGKKALLTQLRSSYGLV